MYKLGLLVFVALVVSACASSEKAPSSSTQSVPSDDPIASGAMDTGYDSDLPPTPARQTPPASEVPQATADQLRQAVQSGNQKEVETVASKLLAVNPKDAKALNALAVNQLRANKPGMARFLLKKVIEIEPSNAMAINNMGIAFLLEGDEARALAEFKKAHAANSENVAAGTNLGALHAKYRNFDEARRVMESVYSSGKSSTLLANNYALSLRGTGDFKAARRVYESALEKDSRNVSMLFNYAFLMVENIGDKTKGQEAINRLKLLATDPAMMDKARQLEAKLK